MTRVKRGVVARRRHKKVLKMAKGYYGARSRVFRVAKQAVIKAGQYAYRDRRQRKRQFRALWIQRINAGARQHGLSYSRFVGGLLGTESAAGYGLLHLEASRSWRSAAGTWRAFARIDNLLDRDHIGSVIVNEGNGRFYEPGRDRTWLVGLHWTGNR